MKRYIPSKKTIGCKRSRKTSLMFEPHMCGQGATKYVTLVVRIQNADRKPSNSSREQHRGV